MVCLIALSSNICLALRVLTEGEGCMEMSVRNQNDKENSRGYVPLKENLW